MFEEEYLKTQDMEKKYNYCMDQIRSHQNKKQLNYENIALVITFGFSINILSTILYETIVNQTNSLAMNQLMVFTIVITLLVWYLYDVFTKKYLPVKKVRYGVMMSMSDYYDTLALRYKDKIKNVIDNGMTKEEYSKFKISLKKFIETNPTLVKIWKLKDEGLKEYPRETQIHYTGLFYGVLFRIVYTISYLPDFRDDNKIGSMYFVTNINIDEPDNPQADEVLESIHNYQMNAIFGDLNWAISAAINEVFK